MNHSGIISTSQSQQGIQNVCVCVCKDNQYFELAASPAFLPSSPFFSVFPSATMVFPRGNLICSLPVVVPPVPFLPILPTISVSLFRQTKVEANITVSLSVPLFCFTISNAHRWWEHHGGLEAKTRSNFST